MEMLGALDSKNPE
ncbi:hypothetical protein CISIN_1g0101501mg, partial [Citrus sinensis]